MCRVIKLVKSIALLKVSIPKKIQIIDCPPRVTKETINGRLMRARDVINVNKHKNLNPNILINEKDLNLLQKQQNQAITER